MKSIIKFNRLLVALVLLLAAGACEKEDFLIFTANSNDSIAFQNEFQQSYLISAETRNNLAERLVWNTPDFDAPTTVTYVAEISATEDFTTIAASSGDIQATHFPINVAHLLAIAEEAGLDNDPTTTDDEGNPNNTTVAYARVKAFAGTSSQGSSGVELTSSVAAMNIEMIEVAPVTSGCERLYPSTFGLVGSAVNDWGGVSTGYASGNDVPFVTNDGVTLYAALKFMDGVFKLRENNDWGVNYGQGEGGEGTIMQGGFGNDIPVTAGNYLVEVNLTDLTISLEASTELWGLVGDATHNGWDGPDVKLVPDPCNDGIFIASNVVLTSGVMKFRQNDDWGVNMGLGEGGEGTLMVGGFGNDIPVTAGTYDVTLNTNDMTYTLTSPFTGGSCEAATASTFGLVGDAVNDWGNNTRGFAAGTDVPFITNGSADVYKTALHVTDGVFKIRENNDWAVNYGQGEDGEGTIMEGGFGNDIPITAGNYLIEFDLSAMTISVEASTELFGIVGDAVSPNGWDGPDLKLIPDPCNENVYVAFGVALSDGAMKFRQNDAWDVNYGLGEGGEGTLMQGGFGNDIPVTAGTYNITLDLNALTYSLDAQ